MRANVKKIFTKLLPFPLSFYELIIKRGIICLCYHIISDEDLEYIKHIIPRYKSEQIFIQDLNYIANKYQAISYENLLNNRECIQNCNNEKFLILTFDDSYSQCYSIIRPLLIQRQMPAIFFILTDTIDNKTMFYRNKLSLCFERLTKMNADQHNHFINDISHAFDRSFNDIELLKKWLYSIYYPNKYVNELCEILEINIADYLMQNKPYLNKLQIKQMYNEGFTIGAHSKSHPHLYLLDEKSAEKEIVESCEIVKEITGQEKVPFAFPFSGSGIDRLFLKRLISKYTFIDYIFDVNGLMKDMDFIINRICVDSSDEIMETSIKNAYKSYAMKNWF